MRKFEVAKGWEEKNISLPSRQTKYAAGYDFEAAETMMIPSIWFMAFSKLGRFIGGGWFKEDDYNRNLFKPTMVHTGISVKMGKDEVLYLSNRSGNPTKKGLIFTNGIGVVDADYDGEVMFQFINILPWATVINKGDRIGQGVFHKFHLADNDKEPDRIRKGGHGHTDES